MLHCQLKHTHNESEIKFLVNHFYILSEFLNTESKLLSYVEPWTFYAVFNYDPQLHNVRQVDINDYNSCTDINPIASFNSGSDSITLDTPGVDYFFLCGIPGHCASGLKFHIKISATPTSIPVTPPPPRTNTNTNTNNSYRGHFPSSINKPTQTMKPHSSASTAYSFNMLFTLFLLAMV